jgi:hypothetical protein
VAALNAAFISHPPIDGKGKTDSSLRPTPARFACPTSWMPDIAGLPVCLKKAAMVSIAQAWLSG